jgi:hypothetical protein|tara:strand:+ start:317 stop:637 length:321 start_codon:yes stop_codon:yes gene_type:complete
MEDDKIIWLEKIGNPENPIRVGFSVDVEAFIFQFGGKTVEISAGKMMSIFLQENLLKVDFTSTSEIVLKFGEHAIEIPVGKISKIFLEEKLFNRRVNLANIRERNF